MKTLFKKSRANGNRNSDRHQTESNTLPQCSTYGSALAVKQRIIPQVLPVSSYPLHTVVEKR